ncbi:transporter [Parapedobacter pyrenivorans]|uniref:Transporter n=1 Tax=Parapedobacter pyrenivorans TaxID=1305674 RepID=A0A917MEV4_9SPHI|nr:TolC family protein [Parapedobacter pyrenivorans]GGG94490.1 transporter [Parapedobacter pyrenivorans]
MSRQVLAFKCLVITLGVLGIYIGRATAQEQITILEAVERAITNNLQVKQAEFQYALSDQDLLLSRMTFYPSVNGAISGSKNWGLSFNTDVGQLTTESANNVNGGISADVSLFQGFSRVHQVAANRHQLMANASNIDKVKNDLALSVATKYLECLTNMDLLTASQQQLALSEEQLAVAQANFEVGNNTLADLSQAKSQVATDELNVTTAENAYDLAILDLKQLMEMQPSVSIELVKPQVADFENTEVVYSAEQVYQQAMTAYPDIKVAQEQSLMAERNIAVARGNYYPSLSLGGNLGTNYSSAIPDIELATPTMRFGKQIRRNFAQSVGITLSIPIFNGLQTRVNVSRAKINYQNALTNEQLAKNNLNKIINQAVLDLRAAEKRYYSTETAFASANDAFEVLSQRFEVGLANSVELFTAQTTRNKAEFDHIQARYNLIFRSKVIDFYLGNEINFETEM